MWYKLFLFVLIDLRSGLVSMESIVTIRSGNEPRMGLSADVLVVFFASVVIPQVAFKYLC